MSDKKETSLTKFSEIKPSFYRPIYEQFLYTFTRTILDSNINYLLPHPNIQRYLNGEDVELNEENKKDLSRFIVKHRNKEDYFIKEHKRLSFTPEEIIDESESLEELYYDVSKIFRDDYNIPLPILKRMKILCNELGYILSSIRHKEKPIPYESSIYTVFENTKQLVDGAISIYNDKHNPHNLEADYIINNANILIHKANEYSSKDTQSNSKDTQSISKETQSNSKETQSNSKEIITPKQHLGAHFDLLLDRLNKAKKDIEESRKFLDIIPDTIDPVTEKLDKLEASVSEINDAKEADDAILIADTKKSDDDNKESDDDNKESDDDTILIDYRLMFIILSSEFIKIFEYEHSAIVDHLGDPNWLKSINAFNTSVSVEQITKMQRSFGDYVVAKAAKTPKKYHNTVCELVKDRSFLEMYMDMCSVYTTSSEFIQDMIMKILVMRFEE